jgi:ribosomal protein L11 methyltransferase
MANDTEPPESWRVTVPCTRAQAEAAQMAEIDWDAAGASPPAIVAREERPDDADHWLIEAYFERPPTPADLAVLRAALPGVQAEPTVEPIAPQPWVALSQAGLPPVAAGRFHVRNRPEDPPRAGAINLLIPASAAFGTGQHETTGGCLLMLDRLHRLGARPRAIADIGSGTGLLVIAAHALWPRARLLASDIDPAAVRAVIGNAAAHGVPLGAGPGAVLPVEAAGAGHDLIRLGAPHDLLIANILAGPLIDLAEDFAAVTAEGGTLILAGLLASQAGAVLGAYRRAGFRLADRIDRGDWPTLRLRRRARPGASRVRRTLRPATGEAPGFGSW